MSFRYFLLLCLLFAPSVQAIVNVEGLHMKTPPPGFSGQLDLGLDGNKGNSENFTASMGSRLQWLHKDVTHLLTLSYEYGESFAQENKNNSFAHARRIAPLSQRTAWELFGQIEQDKFARLNYRGLLGSGVRFTLMERQNKRAVYLGLGAFYSREELATGDTDEGVENHVRANLYLVAKRQLNEYVALGSTTYLQPDVEDARDFRALEDAGLSVKLTEKTNISFAVQIKHDNRPPLGVEKTDISYRTTLHFALD